MTQMTQQNTGRNTNNGPVNNNIRSRNWAFTLNNHTSENIDTLTQTFSSDPKILKWIFQEEMSKSGTPHLQGTVAYKNAMSLNSLKKINKKIHWERCRNLAASLNYCKKKETRSGGIYQSENLKNDLEPKGHGLSEEEVLEHMKKQAMEIGQDIWNELTRKYGYKTKDMLPGEPGNGGRY